MRFHRFASDCVLRTFLSCVCFSSYLLAAAGLLPRVRLLRSFSFAKESGKMQSFLCFSTGSFLLQMSGMDPVCGVCRQVLFQARPSQRLKG